MQHILEALAPRNLPPKLVYSSSQSEKIRLEFLRGGRKFTISSEMLDKLQKIRIRVALSAVRSGYEVGKIVTPALMLKRKQLDSQIVHTSPEVPQKGAKCYKTHRKR